MPHDFTRRHLLALSTAGLATVSLAGCDLLSTAPADEKGPGGGDTAAKEAPKLAEQVAAGKLPPLAERLPETPLVVQPAERAGVYGGEWRTSLLGLADAVWMQRTIGAERSEERRVGKECLAVCRSRWSPYH